MPEAHSALSAFLSQYGYAAIVLGTFLEGETIVILAGFLAHQGYLHPSLVALAAFTGSVSSDLLMFLLARYQGPRLLRRFPRLAAGVDSLAKRVHGHRVPLILSFRFLYGLRNVTPVFLGVSGTPPALFVPLNMTGAACWAAVFTAVGYYFGAGLNAALGHLRHYEAFIMLGLLAVGIGIAVWHHHRKAKKIMPD